MEGLTPYKPLFLSTDSQYVFAQIGHYQMILDESFLPGTTALVEPWPPLQPVSSPLLSIPHLPFPSFHLHPLQVTLNIV
jgi:hypothetical protein